MKIIVLIVSALLLTACAANKNGVPISSYNSAGYSTPQLDPSVYNYNNPSRAQVQRVQSIVRAR